MARKKKTERRSGPSDDDDELPAHLQILNVGRDRGERQSGERQSGERPSGERRSGEAVTEVEERQGGEEPGLDDAPPTAGKGTGKPLAITEGTGKPPRKPSRSAPRPGQLGFAGVEDDGRAASHFKGMSSGARAAHRKKLDQESQRRAYLRGERPDAPPGLSHGPSASADAEVAPPEAPAGFVDVGVWLGDVSARDVGEAARRRQREAGEAGEGAPGKRGLVDELLALAGPRCEGLIGVYAAQQVQG